MDALFITSKLFTCRLNVKSTSTDASSHYSVKTLPKKQFMFVIYFMFFLKTPNVSVAWFLH